MMMAVTPVTPVEGGRHDASNTPAVSSRHHRRSNHTTNTSKYKMFNISNQSPDTRNKDLLPFLRLLPSKLEEAATKLQIVIPPSNLNWLLAHEGRFEYYVEPQTPEYNKLLRKKVYNPATGRRMTLPEIKSKEELNHRQLGHSPRWMHLSSNAPKYRSDLETEARQLWNFLAVCGEYESMLILLAYPPEDPPSIDPQFIKNFMMMKYNPVGVPLTTIGIDSNLNSFHEEDFDVFCGVKDALNRQITCLGTVDSYNSFKKFNATVHHLHEHLCANGKEKYEKACSSCRANFNAFVPVPDGPSVHSPCNKHLRQCYSRSFYVPRGNPMKDQIIQQTKKSLQKESERRKYKPRSASPLLPSEVMKVQAYIQSTGFRPFDFQNFTMILGAILHASRYDGFHDLHHDDFNNKQSEGLFEGFPNQIKSIGCAVFEKVDEEWSHYTVEWNNEHPKLCYLRHILIHVHCTNQRDGYVYANEEALKKLSTPPAPTHFETDDQLEYDTVLPWLKKMLVTVLLHATASKMKMSWHFAKVSYYLWMTLGGAPLEVAQKGARHKTFKMADAYWKDSQSVLQWLTDHPQMLELEPISSFKLRLVDSQNGVIPRLIEQMGGIPPLTLAQTAQFFVEKMLKVSSNSSKYRDRQHLSELSYRKTFSQHSDIGATDQELQSLLLPLTQLGNKARILNIFSQQASELADLRLKVQAIERQHATDWQNVTPNNSNSPGIPTNSPHSPLAPRQLQPDSGIIGPDGKGKYKVIFPVGNNFLAEALVFHLRGVVQSVVGLCPPSVPSPCPYTRFENGRKLLIRSQMSLCTRYLNQFAKCLLLHHGNCPQRFLSSNPRFSKSPNYICQPQT
jgi:hypothetical protein